MAKRKMARALIFLGIVFISPGLLFAGGDFKSKLQQRKSNIQYNLDNLTYSESAAGGPLGGKEQIQGEINAPVASRDLDKQDRSDVTAFSSYAIYKTDYIAEIDEDVVTVKGKVVFEVFRKGLTQIPLVRSNVGLIDVQVNRGSSFVNMQGGRYYLIIDKPGRYSLEIEFLIKAKREREGGPGNFSFEVIPAPISQFEFTMPEKEVEIFIDPSIKTELTREAKRTVAWAVMPNTTAVSVRWTKALPKETITQVQLEPKVYVDTATYAAIGEGVIRCVATLNYSILQSEVPTFRVALPEDASILEVSGNDLRDWKVSTKEGVQYLDVYLNFGVKGNYPLTLSYERKISEGSGVAQIPVTQATGVEREKGYFGIAAATNVELAVNKAEHATPIDVKELPESLWRSTTSPILLAFKYLSHPVAIDIDVTRHEEVPVLVAAIDSADYITLQTDEGKTLTKAIYQLRNNVKQYIRLDLPKGSELWSVFVAGKPVKPGKDQNGSILIPLEKSQLSGEDLTRFPVEVVYLDRSSRMGLLGYMQLDLPKTDIPISQLRWSVFLPLDFAYLHFGGNVKPIKKSTGLFTGFLGGAGALREGIKRYEYPETQSIQSQQVVGDFYRQVQVDKARGVLPIKIDIPQEGRPYSFSKLLISEKETPTLSILFMFVFRPLGWLFKLLILALVFLAVATLFKKALSARPKKQERG